MKPLTVALDILQGEDNTGDIDLQDPGLQIHGDLPEAVVKVIKTRFAEVLEIETAILAAVTLPRFKLRWLRTQERKDNAKAGLLAECRKSAQDEHQLTGTNAPTRNLSTDSAIEDELFSFEDVEDTSASPLIDRAEIDHTVVRCPKCVDLDPTNVKDVKPVPILKMVTRSQGQAQPPMPPTPSKRDPWQVDYEMGEMGCFI
ncbi:unnamed protein product [Merluccius merluccius]